MQLCRLRNVLGAGELQNDADTLEEERWAERFRQLEKSGKERGWQEQGQLGGTGEGDPKGIGLWSEAAD